MFAIIDMEIGNLQSVINAFGRLGIITTVVTTAKEIETAEVLILPGVGAFGDGIEYLSKKGLCEAIQYHALEKKKPLLGICLGMQLLASQSEEHGLHNGLGLIPGKVAKLTPTLKEYRLPNMGWCDVTATRPSILFPKKYKTVPFYFVHSYYLQPEDTKLVTATIEYSGQAITAAVEHKNIFGIQFHPEKSQDAGFTLLDNFINHVKKT